MKNWLKKYGEKRYKYRWAIWGIMGISLLSAVFFACCMISRNLDRAHEAELRKSLTVTPEPEICALCGNGTTLPYHAPVLVNLCTGEVGELRVYDPDPLRRNELAEEQSTGTFNFLHIAGLVGYRDTCDHTCHVTLPKEKMPIDPALFCGDCRTLLANITIEGYVVADLYGSSGITAYAIEAGAEYDIRNYTVFISDQEEPDTLSITVAGSLLFAEKG